MFIGLLRRLMFVGLLICMLHSYKVESTLLLQVVVQVVVQVVLQLLLQAARCTVDSGLSCTVDSGLLTSSGTRSRPFSLPRYFSPNFSLPPPLPCRRRLLRQSLHFCTNQ
jgi:hypothetical protein